MIYIINTRALKYFSFARTKDKHHLDAGHLGCKISHLWIKTWADSKIDRLQKRPGSERGTHTTSLLVTDDRQACF